MFLCVGGKKEKDCDRLVVSKLLNNLKEAEVKLNFDYSRYFVLFW